MAVLKRSRKAHPGPVLKRPPKASPAACPAERALDLRGNLRVWLEAGDKALVAHGWGGQRIEIPASDVGLVRTASDYQIDGVKRRDALLILDRYDQVLLRAPGDWPTFGDLRDVCRAAGLPEPAHLGKYKMMWRSPPGPGPKYSDAVFSAYVNQRRRYRSSRYQSQYGWNFPKAAGYRRLRTSPPGRVPRLMLLAPLTAAVVLGFAFLGMVPGVALPDWFGEVRLPIGIAGALFGAAAGYWLCGLVADFVVDALSWALASARVRRPGPPGRFFRRPGWPLWWSQALTGVTVVGMPVLIMFGLVIALLSGAHGLSDSALVAQLRANGVQVHGFLNDQRNVSTSDNGDQSVTDTGVLVFKDRDGTAWTVTDPAIGGRPLPLNAADPARTHTPVTVVYLRDDPGTAAPSQEMQGSVWTGAPTANVVTGIVLILGAPALLVWRLMSRRRRRWRAGADLLDHIAGS